MIVPGSIAILLSFCFVTASVLPLTPPRRICGADVSSDSMAEAEARFLELKGSREYSASNTTGNVTIPVVFHVISANETLEGGNIPDEQIVAQINVLNADYGQTGISFNLTNTTRTINATWFNNIANGSPEETDAKTTLRVGGPETLNVYTVGFTAVRGLLGFSTFPDMYTARPQYDGVAIMYASLPNGTIPPFNLGRTLTHETGHWVGLYHTFQGGCDGGDLVDDTAPEASPASGCPVSRNTCTNDTVPDPVTNFMDYSDDSCMNQFTPGQAARIRDQISVYRHL